MSEVEQLKKIKKSIMSQQEEIIKQALNDVIQDIEDEEKLTKGFDCNIIRLRYYMKYSQFDISLQCLCRAATKEVNSLKIKECLGLRAMPHKLLTANEELLLNYGYGKNGHMFTQEEKANAIEFMKKNNIPFNLGLFKDVLVCMEYGVIGLEEEKEEEKTRVL